MPTQPWGSKVFVLPERKIATYHLCCVHEAAQPISTFCGYTTRPGHPARLALRLDARFSACQHFSRTLMLCAGFLLLGLHVTTMTVRVARAHARPWPASMHACSESNNPGLGSSPCLCGSTSCLIMTAAGSGGSTRGNCSNTGLMSMLSHSSSV